MNRSRWLAAPALLALLALGQASGAAALVGVLALGVLLLAAIGPRWDLDRGRQIVASILGAGAAYTLASLLYEPLPAHLTEGWTRLSACLVMAAAARLVQPRPGGGPPITALLLLLAVLVAGESRTRGGLFPWLGTLAYPLLSFLFLLSALAALGAAGSPAPRTGRRAVAALLLVAASAGMALALGTGVRAAYARIMQRARTGSHARQVRVGFSDQMELGALGGMLDSSTVVLRVRGPRVDYLRGASFDVYELGRWRRSDAMETEQEASWSAPRPRGADVVEIQALSEREDRLFLPLSARAITPEPGSVKIDPFGVVKRGGKGPPLVVRFRPGPRDRAALAPPGGEDRHLARRVRSRLEGLALRWTEGARSDEEKLDAIQRRLGGPEFRYARAFRRDTDVDPVLDFLLRDRTGHCEYFASGMALVARVIGIPARVTTGYRVAEHNALGGYHVVRERNAHAWVEAWIEGKGWVPYDPTPEGPLTQNQPHETGVGAAVMDLVRVRYDEAVQWLGQRTVGQIAAASTAGLVVLGWLVARGVARREKPRAASPDEEPLPWLRDLLDTLAREGVAHEPHEALSALAGRAGDPEAASLLRRYEALRYGGEGDGASLARETAAWVARRRRPPGAALRGGVLVCGGRGLRGSGGLRWGR